MPDPSSDARPIFVSSLTTLGTTLAATCSTVPIGTLAAGTFRPFGAAVAMVVTGASAGRVVIATMPPTPAEKAAITSAPRVSATGRKRFLRTGGGIVAPPPAPTG